MPIKFNFLDDEYYNYGRVLRLIGYGILSLILLVGFTTEYNIKLKDLAVIPFIGIILALENTILSKIEYRYGKYVRRNCLFLLDVILYSLFISALHVLLIPTFLLVSSLIFIAVVNRIYTVTLLLSPLLGIAVFYFSSLWYFGFTPFLEVSSSELNILTIFSFILLNVVIMFYQAKLMDKYKERIQRDHVEINKYLKLNNQLAKYAPQQIWQSIMNGEIEAKVEYQRRKLTIFFSDIEGFTDLSERLIPDDLAFLLNDYLKHMTEIAKHYGGTIDKFMGDGILIFFGDPSSRGIKEDAIACIEMAVTMRQQMKVLRERWLKLGYESLHIRMGIATGYCHVGNYGTAHRMSYTIVGRDANVAARLQAAAEVDQILISEETFEYIKDDFLCIKNEPLKLKGIQDFVQSWQVIERYEDANQDYKKWYDFEYNGFNLQVNLEKTTSYDYGNMLKALEQTIDRLKLQRARTDDDGVVTLDVTKIVKPMTSNKNKS